MKEAVVRPVAAAVIAEVVRLVAAAVIAEVVRLVAAAVIAELVMLVAAPVIAELVMLVAAPVIAELVMLVAAAGLMAADTAGAGAGADTMAHSSLAQLSVACLAGTAAMAIRVPNISATSNTTPPAIIMGQAVIQLTSLGHGEAVQPR